MKIKFSKFFTLLTISIVVFLGLSFSPYNSTRAIAGSISDCSSLGGDKIYTCQAYYREVQGGANYATINFNDGTKINVFPDGSSIKFDKNGNTISNTADGSTMIYNPNTGKTVIKDSTGNIRTEQLTASAPVEDPFFSNWLKEAGKMGGLITGAVAKTVAMVVGGFLQLIWIPTLSALIYVASFLVDKSVEFTLSIGSLAGIDSSVNIAWVTIRNVFNIFFIFALLYAAIKIIIGQTDNNSKNMLKNVIVAALLINFSLFFTKIIIDAGNIVAAALYNSLTNQGTVGLGSLLMKGMGISGLWGASEASVGGVFSTSFFIISAVQATTLLITLATFIYIAILFIVRTVGLIFLMAFSPVGFMGDVLPFMAPYQKMWRDNLFGLVATAPIFLLFTQIIVTVSSQMKAAMETMSKESDVAYIAYFKYAMVIILLITAVKVTKKFSGAVGSFVDGITKLAVGTAAGVATGGAALAMRKVVGGSAAKMASNEDLKARAAAGSISARMQLAAATKVSKSSFDVRNANIAGFKPGEMISKQTGFDLNGGPKFTQVADGGYAGAQDRAKKAQAARIKTTTNTDSAKVDPWSVDQNRVDSHIAQLRQDAQNDLVNHQTDRSHKEQEFNDPRKTKDEKDKIAQEIAELDKKIAKAQRTANSANDPIATAELEEQARKSISKQDSIDKAKQKERELLSGAPSEAHKQAAAAYRAYAAEQEKTKTTADKTNDLLQQLIQQNQPKP
ncbi:MAG: hypothetical protein WCO10_01755 [bacterium]